MTRRAAHRFATEYRADVHGEGPVGGRTVRILLGRIRTPSPLRAVRWLQVQALRVADGLDPDPAASGWAGHPGTLRELPAGIPDVPSRLRRWAGDEASREAALDRLRSGAPVTLTTADHTGRYSLTIHPVPVPCRPGRGTPARVMSLWSSPVAGRRVPVGGAAGNR